MSAMCSSNNKEKNDSFLAYDILEEFGENLARYRRLYAKNKNNKDGRFDFCINFAWSLYAINELPDEFEEYKILCQEAYQNEVRSEDKREVLTPDLYKK
jgi:hypothetical protein